MCLSQSPLYALSYPYYLIVAHQSKFPHSLSYTFYNSSLCSEVSNETAIFGLFIPKRMEKGFAGEWRKPWKKMNFHCLSQTSIASYPSVDRALLRHPIYLCWSTEIISQDSHSAWESWGDIFPKLFTMQWVLKHLLHATLFYPGTILQHLYSAFQQYLIFTKENNE